MGIGYFIVKLGLWYLITKPFPTFRRWVSRTTLAQALLDTGFGFLGMHVFAMAGGSIVSMIAMVGFCACSMLYIFTHIAINKGKEVYNGYNQKHYI